MKREAKVHKLIYGYGPDRHPITACHLLVVYPSKLQTRLAWDHVTCKNCLRRGGFRR